MIKKLCKHNKQNKKVDQTTACCRNFSSLAHEILFKATS